MATQVVAKNVKLNRQTQYHQQRSECLLYSKKETPLNIRLGLYFLSFFTRWKVDQLSIRFKPENYWKIASIKKSIVHVIAQNKTKSNNVSVPSTIKENLPIYFAIDNVDLKVEKSNFMGLGLRFINKRVGIYHFFWWLSQVGFKVKPKAKTLRRSVRWLNFFEIQIT